MSQEAPGYLFQYQVPPKSPAFSIILKSSIPASLNLAAANIPPNPPPTISTSTSSLRGSLSISSSIYGSSTK